MDLRQEEQEMFLEQLMDNYKNPINFGELKNYSFSKYKKNMSCGDSFTIFIKLTEDRKNIEDVKFNGCGCAISTASFSLFSQELIGKSFEEVKKLTSKDIYKILGVKISPGRVNCAMLCLNAFNEAITEKKK